jgi:hypothetical protein
MASVKRNAKAVWRIRRACRAAPDAGDLDIHAEAVSIQLTIWFCTGTGADPSNMMAVCTTNDGRPNQLQGW